MPRRLDPKKGLPGLFAPGRPKAAEMAFLVEAPRAPAPPPGTASAVETPPVPRKRRPKKEAAVAEAAPVLVAPAPVLVAPAPEPLPDYLRLAPAFRAVPVLPPAPEPLSLRELPALVGCALGWVSSLFKAT